MKPEDVKALVQQLIQADKFSGQYGVPQTPFHIHNGLDSPQLLLTGIAGFPNSYAGFAGYTLVVNATATGLQYSVSPYNPTATTSAAYASGTAYSLTATPALLNLGTTTPSITLTATANYLLLSRVRLDYNGATFAANRTATLKLRKTSGTAADVTNASASFLTQIITTQTYTAGIIELPPVFYSATANDVIQLWGSISVLPTAGSIDAVQAEVVALRLT